MLSQRREARKEKDGGVYYLKNPNTPLRALRLCESQNLPNVLINMPA